MRHTAKKPLNFIRIYKEKIPQFKALLEEKLDEYE